jgi:hypothetical protein
LNIDLHRVLAGLKGHITHQVQKPSQNSPNAPSSLWQGITMNPKRSSIVFPPSAFPSTTCAVIPPTAWISLYVELACMY